MFTIINRCGRLLSCEQHDTSRFPLLIIIIQDNKGVYTEERGEFTVRNYEIAVILSPDLDDKSLPDMKETIKDWISSSGGEIVLTDDRGQRKLAYLIKKKREGYYISWYASLLPSGPSAIEQNMRLNENILRFMVIKSDVPVQVDEKSLPVDADSNVAEPVVSIETSEEITEGNEGTDASANQSLDEKNEGESG
ncbi:MAG: 30S ribosomal protein S6 [Anaerolineaceae bacterium]|nr:30S ribosomal protein S6 [Anaerolineaceae bacterium]